MYTNSNNKSQIVANQKALGDVSKEIGLKAPALSQILLLFERFQKCVAILNEWYEIYTQYRKCFRFALICKYTLVQGRYTMNRLVNKFL